MRKHSGSIAFRVVGCCGDRLLSDQKLWTLASPER